MSSDFFSLNDNDTKELRKEIGLPITKDLIYWFRTESYKWEPAKVTNYEVIEELKPSGSKCLLITLDDGRTVRIHGDYLVDMQKPSFLKDINGEFLKQNNTFGKVGKRIETVLDNYIVLDIETTGKNHLVDEITEIGAIKYEHGEKKDEYNVLVKTEVAIPKKIEKLTGISNDLLCMFGINPREAYEGLKHFLGNSIVVGHNITSFDSYFLDDAYLRELNCHFSNDYIDTLYLARANYPHMQHHTLEYLSKEFNIDYSKAHRAIDDCVITHIVYELMSFGRLLSEENSNYLLSDGSSNYNMPSGNPNSFEEELVEVKASNEWQKKIESRFIDLEREFGLMEHSFSIMANKGKVNDIASYAICVYEPDLVEDRRDNSRNTVLARVKENVLKTNPNIVEVFSKSIENIEDKYRFEKDSDDFIGCLVDCIRKGIQNYNPKAAGFACCSRFHDCSEAKKCIHPNILYAKACQYRKNIEKGDIFY